MITLREFQQHFVHGLHLKDGVICDYIKQDAAMSSEEHLSIYRQSISGALQRVLTEIYAVCKKLVGDEFFDQMINLYTAENISQSPDLGDYGYFFPEFITTYIPAESLPYLSDVARLEWAWHKTYSAPESATIDYKHLASCYQRDIEKIIFSPPPGSFILDSSYPIHRIWGMNQDSYCGNEQIILEENQTYYYLIWRKELTMRIDLLNETQWQILIYCQSKLPLNTVFEKISMNQPAIKVENTFEKILPSMILNGWLAEFEIGS